MGYQSLNTNTFWSHYPQNGEDDHACAFCASQGAPTDAQITICKTLEGFAPISLAELDSLKLQDRIDTKYLIPINFLPTILRSLQTSYRVMTIANRRFFTYENKYLDTADFEFYRLHHNGKANRHKIRLRHYVETDGWFLEIKFKSNKDRTIKHRIPICRKTTDHRLHSDFLHTHFERSVVDSLLPTQYSRYNRITLASPESHERITFDFSLTYHLGDQPVNTPLENDHCLAQNFAELGGTLGLELGQDRVPVQGRAQKLGQDRVPAQGRVQELGQDRVPEQGRVQELGQDRVPVQGRVQELGQDRMLEQGRGQTQGETQDSRFDATQNSSPPKKIALEPICIAELKHENSNHNSDFKKLMHRYAFRPSPFSKYCIGCCLLYPGRIKQNSFKPVLRKISKFKPVYGGSFCV